MLRKNLLQHLSKICLLSISITVVLPALAAPPSRVTGAVNRDRTVAVGTVNPRAEARNDQGVADQALRINHAVVLFETTADQQQQLQDLLRNQQNPSSPDFHRWLTPEQFGEQFGISAGDQAKVAQWLRDEGLTIDESARGRNWVAFSGSAVQVSRALHTSIHRYTVDAESHFANATVPQVPEALAPVIKGFTGLDDFTLKPAPHRFEPIDPSPGYRIGSANYLAPEDFGTIYNLRPVYQSGLDGTGQKIVVVGQSSVLINDMRLFRTRFNLGANDPILQPYAGEPGFNAAQVEGNLDLQWAGAVAPKATIYYVYGTNVLTAIIAAVNANTAPIITISYGGCEIDFSVFLYQAVAQQANAQGITLLASSGDSGAATCDNHGVAPFATRGKAVSFPAVLPEVTAVGGTQFDEGTGDYWATSNSPNFGSAKSYIPEIAWNENSLQSGLGSTGGGVSIRFPKPAWQTGPGVPADGARDLPDISLSAASHVGYIIIYQGGLFSVGGTSASSPALAGVLALLNQQQVTKGFQKAPGLGNINPQLYRLAQVAPAAFHDIISGDNNVPCAQGTPDCLAESFGYPAGPGYDLATGLGSIDGDQFLRQWNTATAATNLTFTINPARITLNETADFTAVVSAAAGTLTPTGVVTFSSGSIALGAVSLSAIDGQQVAKLSFPAYLLGAGTGTINAVYAGDAAFSGSTGSVRLQVVNPTGVAGILTTFSSNPVYAAPPDAQGLLWQTTVTFRETAGVPSNITGFSIDGVAQNLASFFPTVSVPASGSLAVPIVLRNVAYPSVRVFTFTGIDPTGARWTRQHNVRFEGTQVFQNFFMTATPLSMQRNPAADSSCAWSQRLILDETGGYNFTVTSLFASNVNVTSRITAIFGTNRLSAYGSLQGTLCWSGITPPGVNDVYVVLTDESGNTFNQDLIVSFEPAAVTPTRLTAAPASLAIRTAPANLSVDPGGPNQTWTASVFPANRTTSWLRLSRTSGTGPGQITLQSAGEGFRPGVYRASIILQSSSTLPQYLVVPVMYTLGTSGNMTISAVGNAYSFKTVASPGMVMTVYGTELANSVQQPKTVPIPYTVDNVTAFVNGLPAPIFYTSAGQLNIQVPYEAGSGPAVLGINNRGLIAGYQFEITPSAPGIVVDAEGRAVPAVGVKPGGFGTVYMSGEGDVTPTLRTGQAPTSVSAAALPRPRLPLSVTVGGIQAFVQFAGIPQGVVGVSQINFVVPSSLPPGLQPVVVTVNGVSSPAAFITVLAP